MDQIYIAETATNTIPNASLTAASMGCETVAPAVKVRQTNKTCNVDSYHITILVGKHDKNDYSRNTLLKTANQQNVGMCQGQCKANRCLYML